jgi:hypothetical protein
VVELPRATPWPNRLHPSDIVPIVAASLLRANGFDNVSNLAGGYTAWAEANALGWRSAMAIPSTRWSTACNGFVAREKRIAQTESEVDDSVFMGRSGARRS